jgi:TolB protein
LIPVKVVKIAPYSRYNGANRRRFVIPQLLRLIISLLVSAFVTMVAASAVGYLIPTAMIAYDPVHHSARDIALRDTARHLNAYLTRTSADERAPAWSHDGQQLAWLAIENGAQTLWLMNADGGQRRIIARGQAADPSIAALAWSPDGTRIAYTGLTDSRQGIYIIEIASGAQQQITADGISASAPTWSPDGARLAFAWSPVANQEVYIADVSTITEPIASTNGLLRVTDNFMMDAMPAWSPDGRLIALFSDRDGDSNIYVYDIANTTLRRITYNPTRETAPNWTPDGSMLYYRAYRAGEWGVYGVNADCIINGSCEEHHLFDGELTIAWRP